MTTITSTSTLSASLSKRYLTWLLIACGILLLMTMARVTSASPLPSFPDPNLQACFDEQAAAQGWVNAEDVRELVCVELGIWDFYGVEQLPLLESLDLSGNLIKDIFPLHGVSLPNLISLRLGDNQILGLGPLQGYISLQTLWLSGNPGIDFNQLRPIIEQNPNLTRLGLGDINLQEMMMYYGLGDLNINHAAVVELDVSNTGIPYLWGIEMFTSLQVLDASDNFIDYIGELSVAPLSVSLRELRLANNRFTDVAPLMNYRNLQTLWLSGNPGIDFVQLRPIITQNPNLTRPGLGDINLQDKLYGLGDLNINHAAIVELDVSNTGIGDLWGIEAFTALQVLDASGNLIDYIGELSVAPLIDTLRELRLANNHIIDVTPLANYRNLNTLWLSGNPGIDFNQLRPIIEQNPNLTRLGLGDIYLQELMMYYGLGDLNINHAAVVELDVSNTGIDGLWGIEVYTSLQVLDASDNRIFDINPLFNLYALELVDLRGNTSIPCDQLDQLEQILGLDVVLRPTTCAIGHAPDVWIDQPSSGLIVMEGEPVMLSANAFDAEDGDIGASIQWSSNLSGVLGTGASLEIPLLPGDQILLATVTDSDGNTVSRSVNVSVLLNNAPSIEIYPPTDGMPIFEGDQIILKGYAFDAENGDLTFLLQWSSNIDGALGSSSGLWVTLTPGEHTLTASVTDQWGKTTEATTAVTVVANTVPTVVIASPAGDVEVTGGSPLILLGNAYDDEDGDLSQAIDWSSDIDGALGIGASLEVILTAGIHQLTATIIDSHGKTVEASRQVTVVLNNPPQLSMTSPSDGLQIEQYLPLELSAIASDMEDGDLSAGIVWTSDVTGSLGTGDAVKVTLPLGTHLLTASITDSNGKMTSITRSVSVIVPPLADYCAVNGTTRRMWIESVSIDGITNTSGSQGGYADFTGLGPIYLDRAANAIDLVPGF